MGEFNPDSVPAKVVELRRRARRPGTEGSGTEDSEAPPPSFAEFYAGMRENLRQHYGLEPCPEMVQYARVRWRIVRLEEALATLPGLREPPRGDPLATLAWLTRIGKLRDPLDGELHRALRRLFTPERRRPRDSEPGA